jgi:hypothetical protein
VLGRFEIHNVSCLTKNRGEHRECHATSMTAECRITDSRNQIVRQLQELFLTVKVSSVIRHVDSVSEGQQARQEGLIVTSLALTHRVCQ